MEPWRPAAADFTAAPRGEAVGTRGCGAAGGGRAGGSSWCSSAAAGLEVCKYPPGTGEGTRTGTTSPCPAETVLGEAACTLNTPVPKAGAHGGSTGLSTKTFQCRRGLAGLAQCALEMLSAHQTEQKGYFILFLNPFLSRKDSLCWQGESGGADSYLCSAPYTFIPAPILALPAQSLAAGVAAPPRRGHPPQRGAESSVDHPQAPAGGQDMGRGGSSPQVVQGTGSA